MATTTIPWGDGSGDNIYLDYPAASGDQTVAVSSDANTGAARSKVVTFSASGVAPVTLTVEQAAGGGLPAGATAYDWLRSDGTQYIDTGIGNGKTTAQVRIETVTAFLSGTPQYSWSVWASTDAGNMGVQYASSSRISIVGGATQYKQQSNPTYRKGITINYPTMTVVSPYTTTATQAMASATYTADILLLANTGGSRIAVAMIQRTKIWVDGVLVRDYQPCTDPNGRAAAFEHVSRTYNYGANASGNDFTVQNDT